jgi:hypothetical protein
MATRASEFKIDKIEIEQFLKVQIKFLNEIEKLVVGEASLIDIICSWAEKNNVEVEAIAAFILDSKNVALRNRIQAEGEKLRFLKPIRRIAI